MADELGVSPSYVNLIERNQRPVTAQILLKMAEAYDIDLRDLAAADKDRFFAELNEVFSDPLFRQIELPKQELRDLVELCPDAANAVQRLYRAYVEARRGESMAAARLAGPGRDGELRRQPGRARARPDRGQSQSLSGARGRGRGAARRARRAEPRIVSRPFASGCASATAFWCARCRST